MAIDVDKTTQEIVGSLRRKGSCLSLDSMVQESEFGKWGVILYTEYDFKAVGLHFIESETSWKRLGAVAQYNGLINDGHCVIVLVPKRVANDVARMLKDQGGMPRIRLYVLEDVVNKTRGLSELERVNGLTRVHEVDSQAAPSL